MITRIEIDDGTLVAVPGGDRFQFSVNGRKRHTQAVAIELQYTFYAALDSATPLFTLVGRQFKSSPAQYVTIATFKPYQDEIHITLATVVEDEFFKQPLMPDLPHFGLYYAGVSRFWGVPVAVATRGNACPSVGGTVECGPAQLP